MQRFKVGLIHLVATTLVALSLSGCGGSGSSSQKRQQGLPVAAPLPSSVEATEMAIRFLEDRVKRDPDDFIAFNKLANYYLNRQRETGSAGYLDLALRAARASLRAIPAEFNKGGLAVLARAEIASHQFASARDHAIELTRLDPAKSYPYEILGDALVELGDYEKAAAAFFQMERIGGNSVGTETRLARLDLLRGKTDRATERLTTALAIAASVEPRQRETVAWCRLQLGEIAFSTGDYETAERHCRDALVTFPDYYRALGLLGRIRAARGDIEGAIEEYRRVINIIPDPIFVAALGDLYKLAGREADAASQYALVEQIARVNAAGGGIHNRQLALFYADHDIKAEEAHALASKEYSARRDIFGADALAWTALKAGRVDEARAAIKEALRLGTRDARLLYHAGLIAAAAGDIASARDYLTRAITLNPQFDPLQSLNAKRMLGSLSTR